jgi:hypothetical protein
MSSPVLSEPPLKTTQELECWYEYAGSVKEVLATGHRRIDDPDDPQWDALDKPPFNGSPNGYTQVALVTRVDGEIVRKKGVCGYAFHKNKAQEFIRQFLELKAKGSKTPWDQDRTFRDMIAAAEEAKHAGRLEEITLLGQMLVQALRPPNAGGPVSPGSPVTGPERQTPVVEKTDKVSK